MIRSDRMSACLLACLILVAASGPTRAYTAYVTNERDNTISVVDLDQMKTVKTVPVGQRPRGITMTVDGSKILVCASDDDTIQMLDAATLRIVGDLPSGPDPETFALHVSGNPLYVSNEDDNMVTVIDLPSRKVIAEIPTGVEPEGMAVSPDGQTIVNTSETTNMAHFIDYQDAQDGGRRAGRRASARCPVQARRVGGLGLVGTRRHRQRDRSGAAYRDTQDLVRCAGPARRGDPAGGHPVHPGRCDRFRGPWTGQSRRGDRHRRPTRSRNTCWSDSVSGRWRSRRTRNIC